MTKISSVPKLALSRMSQKIGQVKHRIERVVLSDFNLYKPEMKMWPWHTLLGQTVSFICHLQTMLRLFLTLILLKLGEGTETSAIPPVTLEGHRQLTENQPADDNLSPCCVDRQPFCERKGKECEDFIMAPYLLHNCRQGFFFFSFLFSNYSRTISWQSCRSLLSPYTSAMD